jgi:hypothetical protein
MTHTENSNPMTHPQIRLLSETELDDANGGMLGVVVGLAIGIAIGVYKAYKEDPGPDRPW